MLEKFVENCFPWVRHYTEAGEEREFEGASETMCDEPTATLIPHLLVMLRRRR